MGMYHTKSFYSSSYKENIKFSILYFIYRCKKDFVFLYVILNEFYRTMNIAAIREKIRHAGFFIPFRIHFLLVIIALVLAYRWLIKNNAVPETARTAIINVFITVTFWFALAILVISFLSAFIPWILFLFSKKNNRSILKVKTGKSKKMADKQLIEINISSILKPLFGYIRLRLRYDEK